MSASPTRIDVGQTTTLSATASDPENQAIAYAWSASCNGTFSNANAQSTQFTLGSPKPGSGSCTLTVKISDGNGGTNSGTLGLQTGPGVTVEQAPVIDSTYQSATTSSGGDAFTFRVNAHDPQKSALTFAWTASVGTLGAPVSSSGSSQVSWTAPACFDDGVNPTIVATVTDALGIATMQTFLVTPSASASCRFEQSTFVPFGNGVTAIAAGVIYAADPSPDLVAIDTGTSTVGVFTAHAPGFMLATNWTLPSQPSAVAIADVDGDHRNDILVASSDGLVVGLAKNGWLSQPTTFSIAPGQGPTSLAAGDVNGDGKVDVALSNATSNSMTLLLGDGAGGFTVSLDYPEYVDGTRGIRIADFDHDG